MLVDSVELLQGVGTRLVGNEVSIVENTVVGVDNLVNQGADTVLVLLLEIGLAVELGYRSAETVHGTHRIGVVIGELARAIQGTHGLVEPLIALSVEQVGGIDGAVHDEIVLQKTKVLVGVDLVQLREEFRLGNEIAVASGIALRLLEHRQHRQLSLHVLDF